MVSKLININIICLFAHTSQYRFHQGLNYPVKTIIQYSFMHVSVRSFRSEESSFYKEEMCRSHNIEGGEDWETGEEKESRQY